MSNPLLSIEAIASVALSHDQKCDCKVCRAAAGDQDALTACLAALAALEAHEEKTQR